MTFLIQLKSRIYFSNKKMKETKLIDLLKRLNKEEFKDFEKFTSSPYFSRGRDLSPLFKSLKPFYPDFENEKLTDEYIFMKLYPDKKFGNEKSVSLLRTLTSELFNLGKEFLAYSEFNQDINRKNFYRLNQLRKKKLYKDFEKEYKESVSIQEKSEGGNPEDFINKYFLRLSYAEYCVEKGWAVQAYESLFKMGDYAAMITLIRGFRMSELKMVAKSFCNLKPEFSLLEYLINNIDKEKLIDTIRLNENKYFPIIEISYLIHKMTEDFMNEEHFRKLKKLVLENLGLLGHDEKYMIFSIMGSYCVRMTNILNLDSYLKEQFVLFDMSLKLGVLKWRQEDDFQLSLFRNIVITGVIVNELEWVEEFIHKYSPELNPDQRESMTNYSMAYLYAAKKNYDKALEYLIKVKYDFFMFKIDVKNLYFRIYFEMGHIEQAYSILDSMRHYISSTKDLYDIFIDRNTNFIKYASELLRIKSSGVYKNLDLLRNRIEKEVYLESRRWLQKMIDELLNN